MSAWTADDVEQRIREAARALGRLPTSDARFLRFKGVLWPEYAQEKHTAYGAATVSVRPALPQSADIRDMDEAMTWFATYLSPSRPKDGMPADVGRIIWLRCWGFSWPKIEQTRRDIYGYRKGGGRWPPGGNSHVTLRAAFHKGLDALAASLNRAGVERVL
jgi:hypothetical protein